MFFFRKKDPLFLNATHFVATFFCHYIFVKLKKFDSLYGINSGVSLQKNMLFLRTKISFFQIFLLPFFCARFEHNTLDFITILHKKSATLK
ncbi:hypothetical protein D3C81_408560 [compost metagenome]|jgi:hypothetical protein|nr:hypothetical protein [Acinetobacter sp. AC1-2]